MGSDAQFEDAPEDDNENDKEDNGDNNDNNDGGVEESGNIAEEAFVRRKPFYLEPIPSFHEQDVHRVRTLHVDSIVQMSVIENSQKMVAQAMNDYNQALRRSSDLQTQKIKLENEQKEASGNGLPSET